MTDLTPNIPDVAAEVSALFERYEQALIDKDVDVLDATFWRSPHTIRFHAENGYGFDRSTPSCGAAACPASGKAAAARDLTLGRDIANVSRFKIRGHSWSAGELGSLSGAGWKAYAHVSTIAEEPLCRGAKRP